MSRPIGPFELLFVGIVAVQVTIFQLFIKPSQESLTVFLLFFTGEIFLLLVHAYRNFRRSNCLGLLVFFIAVLYWFVLPAWELLVFNGSYHTRGVHVVSDSTSEATAIALIALFFCFGILGYSINPPRKLRLFCRFAFSGGNHDVGTLFLVVFPIVAGALSLAFYTYLSGGYHRAIDFVLASRSATRPWSAQGNYGTSVTPFSIIVRSLMIVSVVMCFQAVVFRDLNRTLKAILLLLGLAIGAAVAVDSGTRSLLLLMVLPVAFTYLVYSNTQRAFRLARLVPAFLALGYVLLLAADLQLANRRTGFSQVASTDVSSTKHNDFFSKTALAVEVAHKEDLTKDSTLWIIATAPIPRVMWDNKPEPMAPVVFTRHTWGIDIQKRGGNDLPSIVGQYFLAWGWLGVIEIGFIFGLLLRIGDEVIRRTPTDGLLIGHGLFLVYLFVGFRFLSFGYLSPLLVYAASNYVYGKLLGASGNRVGGKSGVAARRAVQA